MSLERRFSPLISSIEFSVAILGILELSRFAFPTIVKQYRRQQDLTPQQRAKHLKNPACSECGQEDVKVHLHHQLWQQISDDFKLPDWIKHHPTNATWLCKDRCHQEVHHYQEKIWMDDGTYKTKGRDIYPTLSFEQKQQMVVDALERVLRFYVFEIRFDRVNTPLLAAVEADPELNYPTQHHTPSREKMVNKVCKLLDNQGAVDVVIQVAGEKVTEMMRENILYFDESGTPYINLEATPAVRPRTYDARSVFEQAHGLSRASTKLSPEVIGRAQILQVLMEKASQYTAEVYGDQPTAQRYSLIAQAAQYLIGEPYTPELTF